MAPMLTAPGTRPPLRSAAPWARGAVRRRLRCALAVLIGLCVLAVATDQARAVSPPSIDANAAVLFDADTGQILWGKREHARVAIASTTKLMTALITLEHARLSSVVAEPQYYPAAADSQIGLVPGERMTVHDLLLALLLPSADDAAEDLAYNIGGGSVARFMTMMNRRARRLGLTETHYTTPIGLDTPGNYSTAADLAKLAHYVMGAQPFFRHAVGLTQAVLRSGNHKRVITNRNDLVGRFPWVNGVKTGHTLQAGYVLVGSASGGGMNLISVVLGTPSIAQRDASTLALLRYGFAGFIRLTPVRVGEVITRLRLRDRTGAPAAVIAATGLSRVFARATGLRTRAVLRRPLAGPLAYHARVGTLLVLADGRVIARIALLLAHAVPAPAAPLLDRLAGPITLVVALLLVFGVVVAIGLGRRRTQASAQGRRRR
jgi:D-alanyl-D-alanine carboxypeptidase (penicillin-binding protein 5/6)